MMSLPIPKKTAAEKEGRLARNEDGAERRSPAFKQPKVSNRQGHVPSLHVADRLLQ